MTLRAPICCFLGHVDAGKTSLMDMIRGTKVQAVEAGGITQSLSCSLVPASMLQSHIAQIDGKFKQPVNIAGLLMIDTPGHKAFNIMRDQGSSLCDIAIVVIESHDGVKPQTIESIKMLQEKKIPFVIAMTKLDLIDGYTVTNKTSLQKALKKQSKSTLGYMESYMESLKYDLYKINVTAEFYHKNNKPKTVYSIVPISSKTSEGLSDLLALIVYLAQNLMVNRLELKETFDCTTMGCKMIDSMHYIDVILKNGTISIGDKFAVAGEDGVKIISVRNMWTYNSNTIELTNSVTASAGVRLLCSNADGTYTGVKLHPSNSNDALELAQNEMTLYWNQYKLNENGVVLIAPTFGELDAMYQVYSSNKIPIRHMLVGVIKEKHFNRINFTNPRDQEYNCIIYFGNIDNYDELNNCLTSNSVQLIYSMVIYETFDMWKRYRDDCIIRRKQEYVSKGMVVFPCKLNIMPEYIFMNGGSNDIMLGVKIISGTLYIGTPVTCNMISLGCVVGIEKNNKKVLQANRNDEVCIRIENKHKLTYDKQFKSVNLIYSTLTRNSIDILKKDYRDTMTKYDWLLIIEIMKELGIATKTQTN